MDVNRSTGRGETKRSASVIKMDMAKKDMADVAGTNANLIEPGDYILKCRFRSGIEYNNAIAGFQRNDSDDSRSAELQGINDVRSQGEPTNTLNASNAMSGK